MIWHKYNMIERKAINIVLVLYIDWHDVVKCGQLGMIIHGYG